VLVLHVPSHTYKVLVFAKPPPPLAPQNRSCTHICHLNNHITSHHITSQNENENDEKIVFKSDGGRMGPVSRMTLWFAATSNASTFRTSNTYHSGLQCGLHTLAITPAPTRSVASIVRDIPRSIVQVQIRPLTKESGVCLNGRLGACKHIFTTIANCQQRKGCLL
jgi:hypothetical protein